SLRITPTPSKPSTTPAALGAPSAPGVHDTLRSHMGLTAPSAVATAAAPSSSSSSSSSTATDPELQSSHPLEARLAKWRATQDALKMEGLRRNFGMAEPIRRGMELKVVRAGEWRPAQLGGASGLHSDILTGRDAEIDWEDVFKGEYLPFWSISFVACNELRPVPDFHTEMETRMKMNW
ncbi:proteasome maturation factor UMP1-domain-containing protein, partial [Phyllosticta citricarpa]